MRGYDQAWLNVTWCCHAMPQQNLRKKIIWIVANNRTISDLKPNFSVEWSLSHSHTSGSHVNSGFPPVGVCQEISQEFVLKNGTGQG